ncbi:MAG: hypothetical protein ND866_18645 [Pyrinomonadaceae bacterium]|nr:hypothetical protein [Pyrinomonadaceae bacterium]
MRTLLICCLTAVTNFGALGNVPPQKPLGYVAQSSQSQDGSLLKPEHGTYEDAMEFARFLNGAGISVKSVHRSKLEGFFQGIEKAAFFRTENGVVEVVFFPDPRGAEKVRVTEQRQAGRYLYSFQGQPNPKPNDGFDSNRPMFFLVQRNWFMVLETEELYDSVKSALKKD